MIFLIKYLAYIPSKAMICIVGIVFGITIGSFGASKFKCDQISIANKITQERTRLSNTNMQNINNIEQMNTIPTKKPLSNPHSHVSRFSTQRNLVIAATIYTDLTTMYRFTRSVRTSCPFSAIVMIVVNSTTNDKDFKDLADLYSIIYISREEYFPAHLKQKNQLLFESIYSGRWIIIRNYLLTLQAKGQSYDNVFICDAHDSLFQADVFTHVTDLNPGLYVFQEDVHMTIGKCPLNSDWITICYNKAEAKKLSEKPIICSGTVFGTGTAIQAYLSVMESEMLAASDNCTSFGGSDQGIHNYIIHNNKIPNVAVHQISHEYGFVATLGYSLWIKRNQFGVVQNANGSIYAVIHQWNRSEQMKAQFQREYQIIPPDVRNKKDL